MGIPFVFHVVGKESNKTNTYEFHDSDVAIDAWKQMKKIPNFDTNWDRKMVSSESGTVTITIQVRH